LFRLGPHFLSKNWDVSIWLVKHITQEAVPIWHFIFFIKFGFNVLSNFAFSISLFFFQAGSIRTSGECGVFGGSGERRTGLFGVLCQFWRNFGRENSGWAGPPRIFEKKRVEPAQTGLEQYLELHQLSINVIKETSGWASSTRIVLKMKINGQIEKAFVKRTKVEMKQRFFLKTIEPELYQKYQW